MCSNLKKTDYENNLETIKLQCERDDTIVKHEYRYFRALIVICVSLLLAVICMMILLNETSLITSIQTNVFLLIIKKLLEYLTDLTPFFIITMASIGILIFVNNYYLKGKYKRNDSNKEFT